MPINDDFNTFVVKPLNLTYEIMNRPHLLKLLLLFPMVIIAQNKCGDADSDLLYAYSHVKDSYKSNNISHLKYYAKRSLDAFERSKSKLKKCGCETAYDLAVKGADLLSHVNNQPTYEDGRFYVKRAKEVAQQSIVELDKFTVSDFQEPSPDHSSDLSAINSEKEKLEKLQKELAEKEARVKAQLAVQKEKAELLQKEQLIKAYNEAIANNLASYNNILEICDCDPETFKDIKPKEEDMQDKSVSEIKLHLIKNIKDITSNYLSRLDLCEE